MNMSKQQQLRWYCSNEDPGAADGSGTDAGPRINRRSAVLAGIASGVAFPAGLLAAQDAPPIEPRED